MKIGIVYATGSGMVRRWIVPHADPDLDRNHPVARGEAMLVVDGSTIFSPADITAAVAKAIGRQPADPRCAVVDKAGNVVRVIAADPALDAVDGHDLVAAPADVSAGATYDKTMRVFTKPAPVADAQAEADAIKGG